jgi:hypothetical protein
MTSLPIFFHLEVILAYNTADDTYQWSSPIPEEF